MAVLLCASASFAKKSMDEEEMDLVTAAGQPLVISVDYDDAVNGTLTVTADEMGTITQTIQSNSQINLRALAINNVAGENQVANGVNIQSGAASTGESAAQINEINQSWGATFDWDYAQGTVATAAGGNGGSVTVSGSITNNKVNCITVGAGTSCAASDIANGGDGGDGAVGVLPTEVLSAYADKIIAVSDIGQNSTVNISQMNAQTITQTIESDSQSTLAALAINNVAGSNQVANGTNMTSRGATVIGNAAGTPLIVVDSLSPGTNYAGTQRNTINQFRGTPLSRPDVCNLCVLPIAAAPLP
jgi:hypothetical protein